MTVDLDVEVKRRSTQESVWFRRDMSFAERFLSSPDPQVYEANKEQALRRLWSMLLMTLSYHWSKLVISMPTVLRRQLVIKRKRQRLSQYLATTLIKYWLARLNR